MAMRKGDANLPERTAEVGSSSRFEDRDGRRRICPSPGECRLMAGLVLSVVGIIVWAVSNTAFGSTVPWAATVGASALITGLLLWCTGAVERTLEL